MIPTGLRRLCLLVCGLFSLHLSAEGHAVRPLPQAWLRLMHYHPDGHTYRSKISSAPFFASSEGQQSPESELDAQLKQFHRTTIEISGSEQDPLCVFPARARWLRRHIDPSIPERACPELDTWKGRLQFRSLSMVYSSAYAGNSASMFGHNLLKINLLQATALGAEGDGIELLDYGVGFLAAADPNDGLMYGPKGLFGGYPGFFTLQPYYELVNTYSYAENRDLWELEIPLNEEEKELFLEHLWELLHLGSTPYYFTHVNCSSMLVSLLDAIRPDWNLTAEIQGFVLPAVVMQKINSYLPVAPLQFRPSQRRIFQAHLETLTPVQKQRFASLIDGDSLELDDAAVLDAALLKLNLQKSELDLQEQTSLRAIESKWLWARSHLPPPTFTPEIARPRNNPLLGHAPQKLALQLGALGDEAALAYGLRYRYGWHDLLDPYSGYDPYYHLNYIDVQFKGAEKGQRNDLNLSIAEVWSLSPFHTSDPVKSWMMRGGSSYEGATGTLTSSMEGAVGLAFEFKRDRSLLAVLPSLKAGFQHEPIARPFFSLGGHILWLQRWSDRWQSLLSLEPSWVVLDDSYEASPRATFEVRMNFDRARQLSLTLVRARTNEASLAWSQFY